MNTHAYIECVRGGIIPPEPPDLASPDGSDMRHFKRSIEMHHSRDVCTARGLWCVVDSVWTGVLADWIGDRTVLEIMAGGGWLAKALTEHGVPVTATDNFSWDERHDEMKLVHSVQKMHAIAACATLGGDVLLVSWSPYGEDVICRACEVWGPERPIIYIGEWEGGCNAPDEFFEHFREIDDAPAIPLMSWWGLHDGCSIGHYLVDLGDN